VTSAVVNIVLAVYFPLQPSGSGLSAAASVGIAIAGGFGVIIGILGAGFLLYRHDENKRRLLSPTASTSAAATVESVVWSKPELPATRNL
jgi:hypothetical protein